MSSLSDITILITSFLRLGYLYECLRGIRENLPECEVAIIDDGDLPLALPYPESVKESERGVSIRKLAWGYQHLPFDSGLSAKRNAGVRGARTKYILLGCDDFDFSTPEARMGIHFMLDRLDGCPNLDIAGGRVDGNAYEGFLDYEPGEYISETRLQTEGTVNGQALLCDLTVNYFLGRTEVMKEFPWPESMKIGGEHVCFFLDLKLAGNNVAWVKGANITTLKLGPEAQDPRYASFRARARTLGHPMMMQRYGIKKYLGF